MSGSTSHSVTQAQRLSGDTRRPSQDTRRSSQETCRPSQDSQRIQSRQVPVVRPTQSRRPPRQLSTGAMSSMGTMAAVSMFRLDVPTPPATRATTASVRPSSATPGASGSTNAASPTQGGSKKAKAKALVKMFIPFSRKKRDGHGSDGASGAGGQPGGQTGR